MNTRNPSASGWSTTAFGASEDSVDHERTALGEHLRACERLSGRLFAWRCRASEVHGFMAAHFITTVLLLAALVAIAEMAAS
jgi:hypothetical protein